MLDPTTVAYANPFSSSTGLPDCEVATVTADAERAAKAEVPKPDAPEDVSTRVYEEVLVGPEDAPEGVVTDHP